MLTLSDTRRRIREGRTGEESLCCGWLQFRLSGGWRRSCQAFLRDEVVRMKPFGHPTLDAWAIHFLDRTRRRVMPLCGRT